MRKEFYIIRHGQTDFNKAGIVQGRGVDSDLNRVGQKQAERFYEIYKNVPFDKIYTSSLKRTEQSVQSFIQNGIPWEKLSGLDEMDWGHFEGKPASPDTRSQFDLLLKTWMEGDYSTTLLGGESPLQVIERQQVALDHILKNEKERTILICMHGRAIRLFLCLLTKTELKFMDKFPHQNLSLYRVSYEEPNLLENITNSRNNGIFKIIEFNNTSHTPDEALDF